MLMQRTLRWRLLALAGGALLGYLSWLLLTRRPETLRSGMQQATLFHLSRPDQLNALMAYERTAWAPALSDVSLVAACAGLLLAVVLVVYALSARRAGRSGGGGRRGRLGRRERAAQKQDMRERAELAREVKAELSPPLLADATALRREGWTAREGLPLGPLSGGGPDVFIPPVACNSHVLVYGSTGAGKTRKVLLPAILHPTTLPEEARPSMLIIDPKEELTDCTAQGLSRSGYAVYLYKPTAPGSVRCNVLADAGSFAAVRRVMEQWLACQQAPSPSGAAGHYRRMRLALLVGAAHLLRRQRGDAWRSVSLADVAAFYRPPRTIDTIAEDLRPLMAGTLDPQMADTVGLLSDLAAKPAAFADVMTELRDLMAATWDPCVVASMRGHDLGPAFWQAFVARPSALYVPFAIRETRSLRPVIVTFFDFALEQLRRVAPLARPVRVVIDEFANLGPVDRMEEHISTVRSSGIGFVLATQTPGDISRVYGGIRAGALEGNIATKLMLSGSDPELLASWQMPDFGLVLPRLMTPDTMTVRRSSGLPFQVRTRDVSRGPYKRLAGGAGATADLLCFQQGQLGTGTQSRESTESAEEEEHGGEHATEHEREREEEPVAMVAPQGRGRQISAWE